jgi:hypothetical protein
MKRRKPPTGGGFVERLDSLCCELLLCRDSYLGSGQFALTMLAALAVPMPEVKSHPTPAL